MSGTSSVMFVFGFVGAAWASSVWATMTNFDADFSAYARPALMAQFGSAVVYYDPSGAEVPATALVSGEDGLLEPRPDGEALNRTRTVSVARDEVTPAVRGRLKIGDELWEIESIRANGETLAVLTLVRPEAFELSRARFRRRG